MCYQKILKNDGDIAAQNLTAASGLLNPEQGSQFVDQIFDQSKLKAMILMAKFTSQNKNIDKIDVDARVLYPMNEGVDTGKRGNISTSQVVLNPFTTMAVIEVTDSFLRQNLEQGGFLLAERFSKQIANNIEQFLLDGDLNGPSQPESLFVKNGSLVNRLKDPLLAKRDGIMKQADAGHLVDANNSNDMQRIMIKMKKAMPSQFKTNLDLLKYLMPIDLQDNYQQLLSFRNTALGDMTITGYMKLSASGIGLESIPLMSSNPLKVDQVTFVGTNTYALRYKNLDTTKVWVTPANLTSDGVAVAPYLDTVDYVIDPVNGTISRPSSSNIPSGSIINVTYLSQPEIILTDPKNIALGINYETVNIEKLRIPSRLVTQYSISYDMDVKIIDANKVVKAINVNSDLL